MSQDTEIFDYIIIGSGFGGSVSAMRLAEKGYSVLVIEKGKEYKKEDFPKTNWKFKKFFWAPLLGWFGFQKISFFKEGLVLSGVGVGGGSLVYANTHMFPPDAFFKNPAWIHQNQETGEVYDWKERLLPFYDRAKFMLGTVQNRTLNVEDELLKEVARDMGREETYGSVPVGVYFGDTKKEVDPYFKGLGPLRKGCTHCAGCMVGCQHGAKNTLDYNYLWFARQKSAQVMAETLAWKIEHTAGLYHIHTKSSTSKFRKRRKVLKSRNLVISGGVLGTMKILLQQKHQHKTLSNLSDRLGENLRTNSESLLGVTAKDQKLNHGIAISSVFEPDEHTHVEIVKYPDNSNSMKIFSTIATGGGHPALRPLKWFGNIITRPRQFFKQLFGRNFARKSIIFLVMQTLDNSMRMTYKRFPFFRLSIKNKKENRVPAYIDIGQQVMHRYAEKVDGLPQNALTEVMFNMASTAHILGGAPMGKTAADGVVNERFEVHGYPGMYILDGSIIPGNLGVNPSLTITALSEYAMSLIPEKEGNPWKTLEEELVER